MSGLHSPNEQSLTSKYLELLSLHHREERTQPLLFSKVNKRSIINLPTIFAPVTTTAALTLTRGFGLPFLFFLSETLFSIFSYIITDFRISKMHFAGKMFFHSLRGIIFYTEGAANFTYLQLLRQINSNSNE